MNGAKLELVATSATTIATCPSVVPPVLAPIAIPVDADPFSPGASINEL